MTRDQINQLFRDQDRVALSTLILADFPVEALWEAFRHGYNPQPNSNPKPKPVQPGASLATPGSGPADPWCVVKKYG